MASPAPRRGFTLIELLVVVSIIALLISILLPSLANAKQQAAVARCKANMRGLAQGLRVYLESYDGQLPLNGVLFPKPGGNNFSPTIGYGNGEPDMQKWDLPYGRLWPFASENRKLYVCPSDDFTRSYTQQLVRDDAGTISFIGSTSPAPTATSRGYWSYTSNTVLNSEGQFRNNFSTQKNPNSKPPLPWLDPLKTHTIALESDFVVFVEEDLTSNFNDEVFDAPAYNGNDKLTNRHNFGGNVAFFDGHVDWFSATLFNNVPDATVSNWNAITKSPYTRMFFPDNGAFAHPGI